MRPFPVVVLLPILLLAGCLQAPTSDLVLPDDIPLGAAAEPWSVIAANPNRDREADTAIDPTDPMRVAVLYNERPNDYITGAILTDPITPGLIHHALAVSHDGGATWTRHALPYAGAAPAGSAWNLFCAHGDPNLFIDNDGLIHIVTLALSCGGPALFGYEAVIHATTPDDGATWSEPDIAAIAAGGLAGMFHDRQWTAYDPASGRIGIVWTSFLALNRVALTAVFSEDGGSTWSLPVEIETAYSITAVHNWLVVATWGGDGRFHITGHGAAGDRLLHYAGTPGGSFERTEAPRSDCPDAAGAFGYATSAADFDTGRLFIASPLLDGGRPVATCVFASFDHGATWGTATRIDAAGQPWLAVAPDGALLLAHVALALPYGTPTILVLDPADLSVRQSVGLGPEMLVDSDGDDEPEHGDYDAMAAAGGRFLWALTLPNQEGRPAAEGWNDLDGFAFRGAYTGPAL